MKCEACGYEERNSCDEEFIRVKSVEMDNPHYVIGEFGNPVIQREMIACPKCMTLKLY